jgi:hypothetical protein
VAAPGRGIHQGLRVAARALLVCLPAAAACATLSAAALAVARPVALDYAEPVIYGQALRVVWGEPLYQPIDRLPLTVAAYTPLYYWCAAALQALVGPGFGPGRLLSLTCGLLTALLLGAVAGRRSGGIWVSAFASLLFLALAFPRDRDDVPWLGLYRVDLLGIALSLAAIAVLTWRSDTRGVIASGALAGLALLCKQTFFAALLAGALWLVLDRPRRAVLFAGVAGITLVVPCVLLEAATGAFLQNTLEANVNPFYWAIAGGLLSVFVRTQWLPLALAGVYLGLGRPWLARPSLLVVLYWGAASLSLVGLGKIGANYNYWIEFAAATAILGARGAWAVVYGGNSRLAAMGVVGVMAAVCVQLGGPEGWLRSARALRPELSQEATATDHDFGLLIDRVRREPGAVLAEPMDVVVLAGRPVLFEPFIYSVRLDVGRWKADELVGRICSGEMGLAILGYSLDVGVRMTDGLHALWPAPVLAALDKSMQLEGKQAGRYVYTRRGGSLTPRACPGSVP